MVLFVACAPGPTEPEAALPATSDLPGWTFDPQATGRVEALVEGDGKLHLAGGGVLRRTDVANFVEQSRFYMAGERVTRTFMVDGKPTELSGCRRGFQTTGDLRDGNPYSYRTIESSTSSCEYIVAVGFSTKRRGLIDVSSTTGNTEVLSCEENPDQEICQECEEHPEMEICQEVEEEVVVGNYMVGQHMVVEDLIHQDLVGSYNFIAGNFNSSGCLISGMTHPHNYTIPNPFPGWFSSWYVGGASNTDAQGGCAARSGYFQSFANNHAIPCYVFNPIWYGITGTYHYVEMTNGVNVTSNWGVAYDHYGTMYGACEMALHFDWEGDEYGWHSLRSSGREAPPLPRLSGAKTMLDRNGRSFLSVSAGSKPLSFATEQ